METTIVRLSDINNHPTMRMDAGYHIGKAKGKKAHKVEKRGELVENDLSGNIMLIPEQSQEYNSTKAEQNRISDKVSQLRTEFGIDETPINSTKIRR